MSSTPPVPLGEVLSDPSYPRLKDYLIEFTGLAYYANKDADLAHRIRRRLSGFGLQDCASYLEVLHDPVRGLAEREALIETVTIGESYFFRHREHFDALGALVMPNLIAQKAADRRLRVWCAGCADGAEPYSLSILLRRELTPLLDGWELSILGTDINRQYLAIAREGRFEAWSLRSTPESLRNACFEEQGKQWALTPEYKAGVSFQFDNLAEDPSPPPQLKDFSAFDLIICRNVMIYFDAQLMRRIVQRFHDRLTPGGWLLVGPSEPNMTHFTSFHVVNAPGVTLYQKPRGADRDRAEAVTHRTPAPSISRAFSPPPASEPSAECAERSATNPATQNSIPSLADLRQRADQGDWEKAARSGRALIELDHLNAQAHFHYALVLEQLGKYSEAEQSFRRSIYLDRQIVLAHYHLGLLLQSQGEPQRAKRSFSHALNLLTMRPDDEVLADADGITVAELTKLTRMQVEILEVAS